MRTVWIVLIGFVCCFVALALGGDWLFQVVWYLLTGWVFFLIRAMPKVSIDPVGLVTTIVCLAGLMVGLHLFLRWLYQQIQVFKSPTSEVRSWRWRWTGMILALVVLLFVAGISSVGIAHQSTWLFSSPKSILNTSGGMKVVGARMSAANDLKQIGVALHNHHDTSNAMPPGTTFDEQGNALHGWMTLLLPYIEQDNLFQRIDLRIPWNDPRNAEYFRPVVNSYLHPAGGEQRDDAGFALAHYSGNVHLLNAGKGWAIKDITDGAANTILAGEVSVAYKPWGHPTNWRDPGHGIHTTPNSFGSPMTSENAQFLMADGSVRTITRSTHIDVLKALSTPTGGEQLPANW